MHFSGCDLSSSSLQRLAHSRGFHLQGILCSWEPHSNISELLCYQTREEEKFTNKQQCPYILMYVNKILCVPISLELIIKGQLSPFRDCFCGEETNTKLPIYCPLMTQRQQFNFENSKLIFKIFVSSHSTFCVSQLGSQL